MTQVERDAIIIVLKEVFHYGYGGETHLNILGLLEKIGVPLSEYKTWNEPEVTKLIK